MQNTELDCAICGSRARSIFRNLSAAELRRLQREKTVRNFRRGQIVFYQGDSPSALYCIHSGWVKIFKTGRRSEGTVIRLLGPGDIAGYRALLADESFAATAEAIETSRICVISKKTFLNLARCPADLPNQIMLKLARELKESEDQWLIRSQETTKKRTARFLVWLLEHESGKDKEDSMFRIRLRRNEIAQVIGTTPETLSRTLRSLAEDGIIQLSRSEIIISKPLEIRKIVFD